METATLLSILGAVFIALCIAVFQYLYKNKERSQLIYWLSFFRFLTIFLILLLLINPSLEKNKVETIKPNLLVAIDNSASITYNSGISAIRKLLLEFRENSTLNSKFNIDYYRFGNNIYPLDSLSFDENQSNFSISLQEFSKIYKTNVNPVVFITDGNQTTGNSIEYINYKSPVFPFVVGDTARVDDIFIHKINVNKYTTLHNKFPVELFMNYNGKKPITKKLTIYNKGNKIYSEKFQFSENLTVNIASFFLTAVSKGTQYYTASIETLTNERNTLNNRKSFSINVLEEKSNILILTSAIHPDLGMLKKSIESNKQRSVTISTIANFKNELSNFNLIILYQPSEKFKGVFEEIETRKLNYFIVTGLSTNWEFLNSIQSNFSKRVIEQPEEYHPIFNSSYTRFLTEDINFSNFTPLEDRFGTINFTIPYNALLFQRIGVINTEQPLLATFYNNKQKGGILFGENFWRWRMSSYIQSRTFEKFDRFVSNLMQYLVSNQLSKKLMVEAKSIYYGNEQIKLSASYLDDNFNFDGRAKLWVSISNKESNYVKKFPFSLQKNRFVSEFPSLEEGEYTYTVSVENQIIESTGKFQIIPFEIEQQFMYANDKSLKLLANNTQGQVYYSGDNLKLIEDLTVDNRFKGVQKSNIISMSLIDWKWILGLLLLTLTIEWFTRKYFGKI